MQLRFDDQKLSRLEADPTFTHGFDQSIVKQYRKCIQIIRAAADERDFYAMKSLRFEKLKGDREGQSSMRLNDQWRLIVRLEKNEGGKIVVVISIADYH